MTKITSVFTILLAASVLVLSGCSKSDQHAFAKRKYMPYFVKHRVKQDRSQEQQDIAQRPSLPTLKEEPVQKLQVVETRETHLPKRLEVRQAPVVPPVMKKRSVKSSIPVAMEIPAADEQATPGLETMPEFNRRDAIRQIRHFDEGEHAVALILLIILAILLPPLAVLIVDGLSWSFLLSILLWLLFYIPGLIYALYVIFREA